MYDYLSARGTGWINNNKKDRAGWQARSSYLYTKQVIPLNSPDTDFLRLIIDFLHKKLQ